MRNIDYKEAIQYNAMRREGELRTLSSDGSMPLLSLESWGASEGMLSGYSSYYLFSNGKFVKKVESHNRFPKFKHGDMDVMSLRKEIDIYECNLEMQNVNEVIKFLEDNVVENSERMMNDAGADIIFLRGDKEIRIENNVELFEKIKGMLPCDISK